MMVKTINNNLLMSVLEFHPDTTWNIPKQLSLYNLLQEEPGKLFFFVLIFWETNILKLKLLSVA